MQRQFRRFIAEDKVTRRIKDESSAFTAWYARIRTICKDPHFTDGSDGGIDLIMESAKEVVLCQTKFGGANIDQVRAFADVINSWSKGEDDFEKWLEEVKNPQAKNIYRHVYRSSKNKRKVWEFVSLSNENPTWARILNRHDSTDCEARQISLHDVLYYFSLDKMGATYVDPLRVKATPTSLNAVLRNEFGEIKTLVCMIKIPSLLKSLNEASDWERILSRNVRVKRSKSEVNRSIQRTYCSEPQAFFYGNNGLHIISSSAHLSGDELFVEQPAIINGGQTVSSLMELSHNYHSDSYVLARITIIPKDVQSNSKCARFIDDIIVRSNSNNKMDSWDLRSNDEIQVDIARSLFERRIYYERKVHEWDVYRHIERPKINLRLDITDLGEILACCSSYGPVRYRAEGKEPLFRKKQNGGSYESIFSRSVRSNMDETVSKIRLDDAIDKAIRRIPKRKFTQYPAFPKSAKNFILGRLWMMLEMEDLPHPFPSHEELPRAWDKAIGGLITLLYANFKGHLRQGVSLNDIFRNESYWERCKKVINSKNSSYKTIVKLLRKE